MNPEELRTYCLSKPGVEECFPFDNETLVFKVGGKMFLLCSLESNPLSFNVKCEPEKACKLREKYDFVKPGYHMNKKHWNTVVCEPTASKKFLFDLIDDSYYLIIQSLPAKLKSQISNSPEKGRH